MDQLRNNTLLRRLLLLGAPLALAILGTQHDSDHARQVFEVLSPQVDRFLAVHLGQLVLFPLNALAVYLLLSRVRGAAAFASRAGLGVFVVFYTALDAVAGLAVGTIIRNARQLPADQQSVVAQVVQNLFHDAIVGGGGYYLIGVIGTLGWLVGLLGAAMALRKGGLPRLPTVLLGLSGLLLLVGHVPPWGPLAFGCLLLAMALIEFSSGKGVLLNSS